MDKARMKAKAETCGIILSEDQLEQLAVYAWLLQEWGKKMNLTAITGPEDVENKHFLDSLWLAKQDEVCGTLADVGSGAGFPGMVAKVLKPEIRLCLIEPTGKRVQFLREVATQLGLEAEVLNSRAEDAGRESLYRGQFDCVTARAVAALPVLAEYCLPLVKRQGFFIAMKADAVEELEMATGALEKLGGGEVERRPYALPDGAQRSLVVVRKGRDTPKEYPRQNAKIKKKPL